MNQIGPTFVAILGGIIGLAVIAVAVSQKAQTAGVIQAGGNALANVIGAAVGPVTGSTSTNFGSSFGNTASQIMGSALGNTA